VKVRLKDFQESSVDRLYSFALAAQGEAGGNPQALILASPTGSGKTMIATGLMERIVEGDGEHPGDGNAVFLWLTDQRDLNEQSRRKILEASTTFGAGSVQTIDADFDQETLTPGKVYFLNIQKLSRGSHLTAPRDDRKWTFWETITNTVNESPDRFWLVLDEAHKGMLTRREQEEAASIVQKFVLGSPGEIPAVPLILGISATPQRFVNVLGATARTTRPVQIDPEDVRASGLLKETLVVYHPAKTQPSDWTLLRTAADKLTAYSDKWAAYCQAEDETRVNPVLIVQVEDGTAEAVTRTDLTEAFRVLQDAFGDIADAQMAHCFQEGNAVAVGNRALRYVSPADIQDNQGLKVVFFKMALNTGWDCPRAEVMMSFRRAVDHTLIAQLVGRLVRTPLARTITSNDDLNGVSLFLPHYDEGGVRAVVEYLTSPETGGAAFPEVIEGSEMVELRRDEAANELFRLAETLPTYTIQRARKTTNVRRLMKLGRVLSRDGLDRDAPGTFRTLLVATLDQERQRLMRRREFREAGQDWGQIGVRVVTVKYWDGAEQEEIEAVGASARNIDEVFERAGRKLGEGIHKAYVKARVAEDAAVKPAQAKLEAVAILGDDRARAAIEEVARTCFDGSYETHRAAVRDLTEAQKDAYKALRGQAGAPQHDDLELPETYSARGGDASFGGHIYVDAEGRFATSLNGLERKVLEAEFATGQIEGWFRNLPRKKWSLTIPYTNGAEKPLYPDFVVFRREENGIVVDILDPHSIHLGDSVGKAKGLAMYAQHHGDLFGRIEMIMEDGGQLLRIDLNRQELRDQALAVGTAEALRQLFARANGAG
jgi:type III restriction enzyme